MAKYCKQCGVRHKRNASSCGICGAAFEDVRVTIIRRTVILYVVVALIIASLAVALVVTFSGARGAVRKILWYYTQNSPERIVDSYPVFMLEAEGYGRERLIAIISSDVREMSEYLVYMETDSPQPPNERDRDQLLEYFSTDFGDTFDEEKLEDIQYVWVTLEGQTGGVWSRAVTRFTMIKYDGEWYWWPDNFNYYGKPM